MESLNSIWPVVIAALGIGAIIGAIAYRLFTPTVKNARQLQTQLDEVKEELSSYKTSVSSHFNKTSHLVNELTQDYVKVYKHLAEGAQTLGDPKEFTNVLEQHQGKVLISFGDESDNPGTVISETPVDVSELKETSEEPAEVSGQPVEPATQENISEAIKEVAEKIKGAESTEGASEKTTIEEPQLKVEADTATEQATSDEPQLKVDQEDAIELKQVAEGSQVAKENKGSEGKNDSGDEKAAEITEAEKAVTPPPQPKAEAAKTEKKKQPIGETKQESDFQI